MKRLQSGSSLMGTMVAVVLVIVLVLVYLYGGCGGKAENKRKDQVGETIVGQSIAAAKDDVCRDNLRQVRQALEIANPTGDTAVESLTELKLPASMLSDPIGHEPYEYNAAEGKVKCVHPGHEKY